MRIADRSTTVLFENEVFEHPLAANQVHRQRVKVDPDQTAEKEHFISDF